MFGITNWACPQYSTLKWSHEHFTGEHFVYRLEGKLTILPGVDWDQSTRTKGIYRVAEPGRKGWSKNVDSELGNYDFLLGVDVSSCSDGYHIHSHFPNQIDHRHPAVQADLDSWGKWVLEVRFSGLSRLCQEPDYLSDDWSRRFPTRRYQAYRPQISTSLGKYIVCSHATKPYIHQ